MYTDKHPTSVVNKYHIDSLSFKNTAICLAPYNSFYAMDVDYWRCLPGLLLLFPSSHIYKRDPLNWCKIVKYPESVNHFL